MRTFSSRSSQPSHGSLQALDFGLRVRIQAHSDQQPMFAGAQNLSAVELTSELSLMVSELRIRSFALRGQLEHVTSALMVNVECGFYPLAQRAAQDLAGLLDFARKRRFADADLCFRGSECALRIADLCSREVR